METPPHSPSKSKSRSRSVSKSTRLDFGVSAMEEESPIFYDSHVTTQGFFKGLLDRIKSTNEYNIINITKYINKYYISNYKDLDLIITLLSLEKQDRTESLNEIQKQRVNNVIEYLSHILLFKIPTSLPKKYSIKK